ncbi:MAG: GxxExxY protein, partial [Desulfobacteraceae bacterium]
MEEYLHKELTEKIIGAAMEVHRQLGPGFLEAIYEEALTIELTKAGLVWEKQREVEIVYKGTVLAKKLRCDLIVDCKIIVENKSTSDIIP